MSEQPKISSAPMVLGIIGGALGIPAAICAAFCGAIGGAAKGLGKDLDKLNKVDLSDSTAVANAVLNEGTAKAAESGASSGALIYGVVPLIFAIVGFIISFLYKKNPKLHGIIFLVCGAVTFLPVFSVIPNYFSVAPGILFLLAGGLSMKEAGKLSA